MDKRKGIILAIVLFLFVGLGTYVFAGGSEDLANGQGNDTTSSSNDNDDKNNGQNTPNDETEEGENEGEGGNSRPVNGNSNSGSNLVINGDEESGDNQNIGNADDAFKDVLALIENLENQIEQATKKSNLTDALEYRDNEKVEEKLDSLTDGEAKNDLKERLDKINSILEDNEAPVIAGIKDKEVTKDNVSITINEANVTILLNNKEVTIDELKNIEEEGNYKLEVIDKSFNSTEITFTIDKTLPTANVKNGEHFDSEKEIVFSDDNLSKVVVENRDKLHNNEEYITEYTNVENGNINVTLSEDATYLIKVYDKAGNEKSYWVAIDSNSAEITFLDKEENELSTLTNKDVTIKVYDKFLTEVTIEGPNGTETYKYTDKKDEYFEALNNNEERIFKLTVTEDGTYTVTAKDKVGHSVTEVIEIDQTPAKVDVSYDITEPTNKGITVTLSSDEEIMPVDAGLWNPDKKYANKLQKVYFNNTDETITIVDKAGNETKVSIKITNYDKEAPKNNAVNFLINGINPEKEEINGEKYSVYYGTLFDELYGYIRTNEELKENPTFTLTYGTKEINLSGDDVELRIEDKEEYKYLYYFKYEINEEEFSKIAKEEIVMTVSNIVDLAGNKVEGTWEVSNSNRVFVDTVAPQVKELRINSSNENKQYANETHSVGIYLTVDEKLAKDPIFKINGIEYTEYRQGDADKFQYFLVTKLPENTKEGELEFTIEVEDEFGNTKTFTNKDILNDVGYDKVIFDTTAPELILAGTEETYDRVLRIESGTPLTLKDITAKATDASFGEAVNVKPYKVTFYNNINPGKDYDFSNGLDTQKPSGNRYHVYYRVTDYAGNTTEDVMLVVMSDTTAATIKPNQKDNLHVEVGSEYNHVTATVTDNVDKTQIIEPWEYIRFDFQLNNTFEVYKNINTLIPGKYLAIWDYTDSSGNPSTTLKRWVNVTDTTAPVVKGVSSNTTYFGSIDFEMTDNSGKFIIYYDFEHNYQSCDELMNGDHELFTDTTNPFNEPYTITKDIDNVSVCVVDDSGNKTFFNNINLRKEANNETILNAIENGGTIVLPENTTINVSTNINIPEGTTIIGNDTTKLEGQLELKNSNITLKNINIYDNGSVILINKNLENIVIDGGNYITNNVGNQGMGAIRLDGMSNGFEYTNDIIIKNANIQGAIHLLNYSGSLKNISNNTITLTNNDGVSSLAGILITTDKTTDLDAEALLKNQTKVNVNYSLDNEGRTSYYTAIQDLNWKNVLAVEVTK